MRDTDKILKAEENIQNIAAELTRMRDAANLLQVAQEKTDAILDAAEKVIKDAGVFSVACGEIISKLSATDLNQRLDNVHGVMIQIAGLVSEQEKKASDAIATTESRLAVLENALETVAKRSKKQYTISTVLIILTLVTSLAVLAVISLRGIGG